MGLFSDPGAGAHVPRALASLRCERGSCLVGFLPESQGGCLRRTGRSVGPTSPAGKPSGHGAQELVSATNPSFPSTAPLSRLCPSPARWLSPQSNNLTGSPGRRLGALCHTPASQTDLSPRWRKDKVLAQSRAKEEVSGRVLRAGDISSCSLRISSEQKDHRCWALLVPRPSQTQAFG